MCGIVGIVGSPTAAQFLYKGLKLLEYRGYDSAGIVLRDGGQDALLRARVSGRVERLEPLLEGLKGTVGIGHTRWATHGRPVVENAHPLISKDTVAVAHNGIIENHEALRAELEDDGYEFASETDTEVVAHLIERELRVGGDLLAVVRKAVARLEGAFALAVLLRSGEQSLLCARMGSPLLAGIENGQGFVSSDPAPICECTPNVIHLENGDVAEVAAGGLRVLDSAGVSVERKMHRYDRASVAVNLGARRHFMEKEIYEQPEAISASIKHCVDGEEIPVDAFGQDAAEIFAEVDDITMLACGTSLYAAMVARHWIEELAGIACRVEIASEHRYSQSPCDGHLLVSVSQSGETADTLAAVASAMGRNARIHLAVGNVRSSSLMRESRLSFLIHAGPEIGVASTKAFTCQLAALYILALAVGKTKNRLSRESERQHISRLRHLPFAVGKALLLDGAMKDWARQIRDCSAVLFIGRSLHYPIALEGALKLKEISYIHAEGYAGGELKHGPLALVDSHMPVIGLAPDNALLSKMSANLSEVAAREGRLFIVTGKRLPDDNGAGGGSLVRLDDDVSELLSPVVYAVLMQLLAYYTAREKGTDIDKPRNLAKSVTVE